MPAARIRSHDCGVHHVLTTRSGTVRTRGNTDACSHARFRFDASRSCQQALHTATAAPSLAPRLYLPQIMELGAFMAFTTTCRRLCGTLGAPRLKPYPTCVISH